MKNKVILFILTICMVFFIGIVLQSRKRCDADLSFIVLSDIHGNDRKFKNAMKDLYSINSNVDALVLNGDSVDQGLEEQYEAIENVINKNFKIIPENIIKNIGNHEYYNYSYKVDTEENVSERLERYKRFSGEEKIYHDTWIKGYHFISIGSDNNGIDKVNYTRGCISEEQIRWLRKVIGEDYEKGRPIFVFSHQPMDIDFFGIKDKGVDKSDEVKEILSQYPEVILFTSHTHKTPSEEEVKADGFIEVNTGAVNSNYVFDENTKEGFREDKSYSNGVYVEVKDNNVDIKVRDFVKNKWIYIRKIRV